MTCFIEEWGTNDFCGNFSVFLQAINQPNSFIFAKRNPGLVIVPPSVFIHVNTQSFGRMTAKDRPASRISVSTSERMTLPTAAGSRRERRGIPFGQLRAASLRVAAPSPQSAKPDFPNWNQLARKFPLSYGRAPPLLGYLHRQSLLFWPQIPGSQYREIYKEGNAQSASLAIALHPMAGSYELSRLGTFP